LLKPNRHLRLQRRRMMRLHQSKEKIPKTKMLKKRMRKVMTRLTKSTRPHLKRPMPSRAETRKLILSSTKPRKRTSQPPLKLTHSPRLSPPSRRNPRLLTKRSSKRPLTPPSKRLQSKKSRSKKPDLKR